MSINWNDREPIYRQLQDHVIGLILDGILAPGDPLPSVRQVAADFQINPITVLKAYQDLVDQDLVEKQRGVGMFVTEGAVTRLRETERKRFLEEEWPMLRERVRRLGLELEDLLALDAREDEADKKQSEDGNSEGGRS